VAQGEFQIAQGGSRQGPPPDGRGRVKVAVSGLELVRKGVKYARTGMAKSQFAILFADHFQAARE
jgi:hypothetical protein